MINYRKAVSEDIEELLKVRLDFLIDAGNIRNEDERAAMLVSNRTFLSKSLCDGRFVQWLAILDGQIIGTSSVSYYQLPPHTFRPSGKVAYIGNMFTYKEFRGKGIGTKLLSLSVEDAKEKGCTEILLDATDMGRPIYEKYGFKQSKSAMFL